MASKPRTDEFASVWADPISRRSLLHAAGIGIGLFAIGGTAAACTAEAPASDSDTGETGGTIPTAMANIFLDLDPTTASQVGTAAINDFVYESLYRVDPFPPRTELTPELATELPIQLSPTTYRIPIREGVTFHDGTPLTAEDVVFTIERIKDAATNSLFARFFEIITTAAATGDHEIELTLSAPTTLLAQRLALVKGMSRAAVSGTPEALTLQPVGTGPYQVASAVSGQRIALSRFEDYSGAREFSYDEIEISVVADPNARISGLRSGQTRVIEDVPASAYEGLSTASDVRAEGVPSNMQTGLMFHCAKPPFDDVRVRQAVMYAIDRDSITETSFFGQAEPVWAGDIATDDPDYVAPGTTYRYDPDYARQLLAAAGYAGTPIPVDFLVGSNLAYLASQAPVIEENLRAVGFEPNSIPGELESLYSRVSEGSYNLFLMKGDASALGVTDAEFILRWTYYGGLPRQFMFWDGDGLARVENLLDQALTAGDDESRRQLLGEVQNIIQDEVPVGRLHRTNQLTGWSAQLDGFRPAPVPGFVLDGVSG